MEPLIETDADETMMVNYGGDDAGEICAVWSNIVLRKPSAIHIAIGVVHALVAQGGLTPTKNSEKNRTVSLWQAWTTGPSLMDRDKQRKVTAKSPGEPLRFSVKVKPIMVIWSMLVQWKGLEDQAAIKETAESLNRLGMPRVDCQIRH